MAQQQERVRARAPLIESYIIDGGIQLIKFWLEVSMEKQEKRFMARFDDRLRQWKLSPMDVEPFNRWYDYSRARGLRLASASLEARSSPYSSGSERTCTATPGRSKRVAAGGILITGVPNVAYDNSMM